MNTKENNNDDDMYDLLNSSIVSSGTAIENGPENNTRVVSGLFQDEHDISMDTIMNDVNMNCKDNVRKHSRELCDRERLSRELHTKNNADTRTIKDNMNIDSCEVNKGNIENSKSDKNKTDVDRTELTKKDTTTTTTTTTELSVEIFKKFCQNKQLKDENNNKKMIGTGKTLTVQDDELEVFGSTTDSLMQFGNLLTSDLVVQHHGRQYFAHKSAISSILDMNALGMDAFVIEYKRDYHPYLEKIVEIFTINEKVSLFHLAQFIFYGYYRQFPFEKFSDNRVAEFMTEIITEHNISMPDSLNEHVRRAIEQIYDHYLDNIFIIPKRCVSIEDYKQRLIDMLHVAVKFKVVLIIDDILDMCDFRINWFEMYTPFSPIKCGGALGRVKEKVLCNIEKNFEDMIDNICTDYTKHIEQFNYEDLSLLLSKDSLRVSNEMQVWKVFHIWALAHQNKTNEIRDFVCYHLRYGLLLQNELNEIFSSLFILLPRDIYQNIYVNVCKNYSMINGLICNGKLVYYKNRVFGDAHHATKLRKFTEIILVFGGWMVGTQANFVECFVPNLDLILDITEIPMFDMGAYFACEYYDGHLYIFGGSSRDALSNSCMSLSFIDNSRYRWKKMRNMSTSRCYVASCVYRGTLVALGGFDGKERLATVEYYEPSKNAWYPMPRMLHSRSDGCAVVLNDRIYIAGGINTNCIEHTLEMYDPDRRKWIACADMLIPRTSFAMVAYKGRIWALGGNSGTRRLASVDSYDPITNTWQIEASLNEARSTFKATVFRNHIYVFGGYNGGGPISTVERYNPDTNVWTVHDHLHFDRSGHSVVHLPYEAASKFDIPTIISNR